MPKKQTTEMTRWDAQLAALAQQSTQIVSGLGGVGNFIKTRGGLSYQGSAIPDNRLNAVIIAHVKHNAWYGAEEFDEKNPRAPECYAFGDSAGDPDWIMKPHTDSVNPQEKECAGCHWNEFGTADRGRGKACKNMVRLALIAQGDLKDVAHAEIAYLHTPPTSGAAWALYVKEIAETLARPPLGVVTEVRWAPDTRTVFRLEFKLISQIDDGAVIGALIERNAKEQKNIVFPYVVLEKAAPAKPAPRAAAKRKF